MKRYVVRRILSLIPILLGITFLSFALMHVAGSDAVLQSVDASGVELSRDVIEAQRAELGLDRPFLVQYVSWLGGFLTGNMGVSYISGDDVFSTFLSKLPATLFLTVLSLFLTILIAVPLGILSAIRQNRFTDWLIRGCSFVGNSLPNFFVALLLMYLLSIRFPVFPVISGDISLKSAALPALTLAIAMSSRYLRQIRTAVLGRTGKGVCGGREGAGNPVFRYACEKRAPLLPVHHLYPSGALCGQSAGRHSHC